MIQETKSWCSVVTLRDGVGRGEFRREGAFLPMANSC